MANLCPTCLNTLKKEDKLCPICGTKIKKNWKKYIKFISFALIILALFSMPFLYLKWHFSPVKVATSFYEALEKRDVQAIKNTVVHKDQTPISLTEAQAVIDLISVVGEIEVDKLFSATQQTGLLKLYKMSAEPVSIKAVEKPLQIKIKDSNPSNLIPGKYNVTVMKEGTLRSKVKESIIVQKNSTPLPLLPKPKEISIAYAYNFPLITYHELSIALNGKITTLDELLSNEPVTIFYDKLPSYQIIGTWPWGKVTSDSYHLADGISFEVIPFLNKKQETQLINISFEVLTALSANKENIEQTSAHFRSSKKQLVKPLKSDLKIKYFSAIDLTVDENGEFNGIYSSFSTDAVQYNAHFLFEESSQKWQLNDLKSSNVLEMNDFVSRSNSNYTLSRIYELPLTSLSEGQLKLLFRKNFSYDINFPTPTADSGKQSEEKDTVPACSDAIFYKDWTLVSVRVLSDSEAEVKSIDTCVDGQQYATTTIVKKNGHDNWLFREAEPRIKIQP